MCTKFHLDPTFCSKDNVRKRKKYQILVLFLEAILQYYRFLFGTFLFLLLQLENKTNLLVIYVKFDILSYYLNMKTVFFSFTTVVLYSYQ